MKGQISDADTHVMQEVVREAGRDRQAQQRVHNSQRDNRPIAAKQLGNTAAEQGSQPGFELNFRVALEAFEVVHRFEKRFLN